MVMKRLKDVVALFLVSIFVLFFYSQVRLTENDSYSGPLLNSEGGGIHRSKDLVRLPNANLPKKTKKFDPNMHWNQHPPPVDKACLLNPSIVHHNQFPEEDIGFLNTTKGKEYKKILIWHHEYDSNAFFGSGYKPFEAACCKEKRCFVTSKRDQLPVEDYDALIVHFRGLPLNSLPKKRKSHQRWIFYEREAPIRSGKHPEAYEGVFNWTMTYRRDSDVIAACGYIYPKEMLNLSNDSSLEANISKLDFNTSNKTKMAAWMVSNCKSNSNRETYVKRLQKHIKIDVYGDCGPLKCSKATKVKCYKHLESEYKFYLSFENSLCKDYTTEKLFSLLSFDIVPVVFGSGDYAAIAPPHSYIDVRDYKTEKELATYLIFLDKNKEAYEEYFKWKQDYNVFSILSWMVAGFNFCSLCAKLHEDIETKTYNNLRQWFVDEAKCHSFY